ncbi:MAG TPA: glycosyltransferase, partial [Vicinamibacterales bacterium]|nr:glycosyltransferase [Vicinamibacterales bacterium]
PVEIVLVDDGSTTPWPDEVDRFLARHRDIVTRVTHTRNCGLSAARNTGIAHARFDLVIPLDADDWFLPGSLAPLAAVLSDEVDIAYGDVVDSGKVYTPVTRPLRRADFLQDTPLFCSSLFRKTVWQAVNGYTVRSGPHYEDWNFWAKAFKAGFRFHYAPVTVYEHRSRPDSMLRQLHDQRARYVQVATAPLLDMPDPEEAPAAPAPQQVATAPRLDKSDSEETPAAPALPEVPPPAGAAEPPESPRAAADRLAEIVGPLASDARVALLLRMLAGDSCEALAAERGLTPEELPRLVRRLLEAGARALDGADRRSSSPELLLAHARIGRLMIELDRARAELARARDAGRSAELASAHAVIGRLLLPQQRAAADAARAATCAAARKPRRRGRVEAAASDPGHERDRPTPRRPAGPRRGGASS